MTKCKDCGHDRFEHQYEEWWDGENEHVWIGKCEVEGCNCEAFEW